LFLFLNLLAGCGFAIPSGLSAFIPLLIMSVLSNRHKLEIYGPFAWLSSVKLAYHVDIGSLGRWRSSTQQDAPHGESGQ
jgi:hypothetical protein